MPKPQIDGIYEVNPAALAASVTTSEKIPVRVLSGTRWIIPKTATSLQAHQAVSARRFRAAEFDRDLNFPAGLLVCWIREPGTTGLRAATGPDAVQQLRALDRPDLSRFHDFLYGAAKENNLQLDLVNAPDLTALIPEENQPMTEAPATGTAFAPRADTVGSFHLVAPVAVEDGELYADLDEGKVSKHLTDAIDRMKAGLRGGEIFAVWDFETRPNPRQAAAAARTERPARALVHVGGGEMLQLADVYRLDMLIKEG
ncbi:hypothetical protein AB0E08_07545 [Streptomyces sp. NPDC048281]|uniref:hypothetical protein n=1 Tax=Streptomyces sp. NPDC048281 TaxID=3154715 RepID=UPI00341BF0A0